MVQSLKNTVAINNDILIDMEKYYLETWENIN